MEYRIRYTVNGSQNESTQYYSVFHSSEAIDFLAHTLRAGHIHGNNLHLLSVEEYERFSQKWIDRTLKAAEHALAPELSTEGSQLWLRNEN